jgi:hypothetical protein
VNKAYISAASGTRSSMIEAAALRLEHVSLDPESELGAEERSLRPTPSIGP